MICSPPSIRYILMLYIMYTFTSDTMDETKLNNEHQLISNTKRSSNDNDCCERVGYQDTSMCGVRSVYVYVWGIFMKKSE